MIPERLPDPTDQERVCLLAGRWIISAELAMRLCQGARELPYGLQIISGYRTAEHQAQLEAEGRPAAPDHLSTHRSCPATGADVWPMGVDAVPAVKAAIGAAMIRAGLRWGGGSKVDSTGIPSDWNHFDLGPRQQ